MLTESTINEAGFTDPLGGIGKALKSLGDVGKKIKSMVDKFDVAQFKRSLGIKDLKDLDVALSKVKVDSDEFGAILFTILEKIEKSKNNKELQQELNRIYEKHLERQIEYVSDKLANETDPKKAANYYGDLVSMLSLIWDKKSPLIDDILRSSVRYLDIGEAKLKKKYEVPKDIQNILRIPTKRLNVEEKVKARDYYEDQINKLSAEIYRSGRTDKSSIDKMIEYGKKLKELEK